MKPEIEFISPYDEETSDLSKSLKDRSHFLTTARSFPSLRLSYRNICDFELLATAAFSPVNSFLGEKDYLSVSETMRLTDGTLFPIPITLAVKSLDEVKLGSEYALVDQFNDILATIRVEEIYEADLEKEARLVYGTTDRSHPLVAEMDSWGRFNISGKLTVINKPKHYDFDAYRLTPDQVRQKLLTIGNKNVVAFQTRNPLHRAHEEMTKRATEEIGGTLLLQPVVGMTQAGDIEHYTRVRSYQRLVENNYQHHQVVLSLLPLAMRMAGPREALWHAIIRRNFGANHLIVGRHHASPKNGSDGKPFYGEYDAHELLLKHQDEIGVKPVLFSEFVYLPEEERYEEVTKIAKGEKYFSLSGTDIRRRLENDEVIPEWYLRPETADGLREAIPPKHKRGFCIWLTGLSGAGKSTIANILVRKLLATGRKVTLLDGDNVRTHLSKGLGFSKEDRDTNIRRIGFVASEIVKHNGVAICAAISPFADIRNECRVMIGESEFIEVFVDTPLEICEERDTKGLYSEARKGQIKDFTGIDSPYEAPQNAEIRLETVGQTPEDAAKIIIAHLENARLLKSSTDGWHDAVETAKTA